MKILGVGNSFTRNATKFLPQMISADPKINAEVGVAYIGGCDLQKHVTLANAHEQDESKGNQYQYTLDGKTKMTGASLKAILTAKNWDYITIQQVSSKSYKPESFHPYADDLITYIKKYQPDAQIVIHETWAHSPASPRVKTWNLSPGDMYQKLHRNYTDLAQKYDSKIIPVGTAFHQAKTTPEWSFEATPVDVRELNARLSWPEDKDNLPVNRKTLHNDVYWKKKGDSEERAVFADGYHANYRGEYLGGLVWFESFFGKPATGVTYRPESISAAQAESLKKVAREAIEIYRSESRKHKAEPAVAAPSE